MEPGPHLYHPLKHVCQGQEGDADILGTWNDGSLKVKDKPCQQI